MLRLKAGDDLKDQLPDRFCWLGARLAPGGRPRANGASQYSPRAFVLEIWISPLSRLWVKPVPRWHGSSEDHRAALTHGSIASYVRANHVRKAPNLVEFRIDLGKGVRSAQEVSDAFDEVARFFAEARQPTKLMGGLDFIQHFSETGRTSLLDPLARNARRYGQLATRFDDMHKVMFGPPAAFATLTMKERDATFERVTTVGTGPRQMTVALARTPQKRYRRFALPPRGLLLD